MRARASALVVSALLLPASAPSEEPIDLRRIEEVHLDDAQPAVGGERVVELYFRALTQHGEPVKQLRSPHVRILEDGERIDPEDVTLITLGESRRGVTCVLAIDRSATMKGDAFERSRAAAIDFVDRLGSHDRLAVVSFAGEVEVVTDFDDSPAQARARLESLAIDDASLSTSLYDGTYKALELIRSDHQLPRRAFVIVLSDGKDQGSVRDLEQVIAFGRGEGLEARVLVFSIGYARFGGEGLGALRRLASETGGDFFRASSSVHLEFFYDQIWRQLRDSYLARFPSDMDGDLHSIQLEIEGQADTRQVAYPDLPNPFLRPLLLGMGLLFLAAALALLWSRRQAGRLVFVNGPLAGDCVPLRSGRLRIGALDDNEVVIPLETVSKHHAELVVRGRRVEIRDLHATNPTRVNGTEIRRSPLRPGDRIRIAEVELVFER